MAKTILIVEDDSKQLTLARDILKHAGFKTLEATNGEEGVKLAKKHKPDLIFMDIMMPKMDGYTACNEIKKDKSTKAIPVVMLTALDLPLNIKLADEVGSDGYVTKPLVLNEELMDIINKFSPSS